MGNPQGAPLSTVAWIGLILFIVFFFVFFFGIIMLEHQKPDVQAWVWWVVVISIILIIVGFWMYAAGNSSLPRYRELICHDKGWQQKYGNVNVQQQQTMTSVQQPSGIFGPNISVSP